jgi:hypothetical protein
MAYYRIPRHAEKEEEERRAHKWGHDIVEQVHRGREDVVQSHMKTSVKRLLTKTSRFLQNTMTCEAKKQEEDQRARKQRHDRVEQVRGGREDVV